MNTQAMPGARTLGQLIEKTQIPNRSFGAFWLGGHSLALKSARQQVYLIDPAFSRDHRNGPVGTIDIRPDLVFCTLPAPDGLDLSTLTHLSTAFPNARFVGSEKNRDWMIGRRGTAAWDEVPVDPYKVHALENEARLDVRQVSVADTLKIRILPGPGGEITEPWNVLFNFGGGLLVCLVRSVDGDGAVESLLCATTRRIDMMLWSMDRDNLTEAVEVIRGIKPRYAIPVGYDLIPGGRDLSRQFREEIGKIGGVQVYLFADDYMEGAIYSRIMSRMRGL
ncbi:MAG: hypothetical protein O7G87_09450 [bacterium]|nr:hypothetical protein [bacterium]